MRLPNFLKPRKTSMLISGDHESAVYTYDAEPLRWVRPGDEFEVDVIPYDVVLESRYTGTVTDTRDFTAALSYRGRPFGTVSANLEPLKRIAAVCGPVRIPVRCIGWYMPGVPELVSMTPAPFELRKSIR